jgi:hypothetical protein
MKQPQDKTGDNLFSQQPMKTITPSVKKPKITAEYCRSVSGDLLNSILDVTNAFANKNGYFTVGFKGNQLAWYQLMGNLSSCASNLDLDSDVQYVVFSDKLLKSTNDDAKAEMERIEKIFHKKWLQFRNVWILTESDLWKYLQNRVRRFPDPASQKLMDVIGHA